jgi:mono/diheme cytochrome c family protein
MHALASIPAMWLFAASVASASPAAPAGKAAKSPDALALLETHCVACHGGEKTKGGLDITSRESLLRGGESGPSVVPGKPQSSLLYQLVTHAKEPAMPNKKPKLARGDLAAISDWIKAGVPYSRALSKGTTPTSNQTRGEFAITDDDRQHWAFQPIKRPAPPTISNPQSAIRNPIDQFILAKLRAAGLQPAPPATKETLIRRVTLDLIGLPPTPKEIDAFLADTSPQAYERLIDRLLASPHYGERWGRHWLDLARFAETDGFEHDAVRPHSWRYRDYVVHAFNADKPYDRFIREQLAGDELWPDDSDALIATGFNLLGPDMVDSADQIQRRLNTLNDMTDTAGLVFLGLTVGCARCHDHKFEPLSQRDYYGLQAFFAPAQFKRDQTIGSPAERAANDAAMRKVNNHPKMRQLTELEEQAREKLRQKKLAKLSPEAQTAHNTPPEKRTAEEANLVLETQAMVEVFDKELTESLSAEEKARRAALRREVATLQKPPPLPMTMALANSNNVPAKTAILHRGDYNSPRDLVEAGFPLVLGGPGSTPAQMSRGAGGTARSHAQSRTALANWLAAPDNPLTARVMVNRIWQHHFGRGLVAMPSDFGTHGAKASHPELLDWLASEFIARGWSLKQMHKLMLASATYQQSTSGGTGSTSSQTLSSKAALNKSNQGAGGIAPSQIDPDNRLYWRFNRLRLEGEVVRDSLLAVSGQLNLKMGGLGVFPPIPEDVFKGAKGWTVSKDARDYSRRSLYIFARRNLRFPFLEVFDAPDSNLSCPARERSTTAPQSLTLLNADEVVTAAKATAARLTREADSDETRVALAYRLILGRPPTAKEAAMSREFLSQSPLNELCRALFNLNAFVYLD